MGYFMDYYKIEVEGSADTVKSICEAIKSYSHEDCKIEQNGSEILIWDTLRVTSDIDTAYDFAIMLARAANGTNFKMEGSNEYSVGGGTMFYVAELKNGKLTFSNTDWCYACNREEFEDYETYEDFCEDCGDDEISSEEDFIKAKENEFTYTLNGKVYTELPIEETVVLEF